MTYYGAGETAKLAAEDARKVEGSAKSTDVRDLAAAIALLADAVEQLCKAHHRES